MSWQDHLTAAGVDTEAGIAQVGGDPEFYREALCLFLPENRQPLPVPDAPPKDWVLPAHSLKSDCRTLGAHSCGELAAAVEEAAREGDPAALHALIPDLLTKLSQLETAIRAALHP